MTLSSYIVTFFENLQQLITSVEETLALAKQYFDRNGLLINTKKTQCIFIGSLQYVARIPNNTTIKYVQKGYGIIILY